MANRMVQSENRQSARMPIVARACQNFLKRRGLQEAAVLEASKLTKEVAGAGREGQVNFPVLLGSQVTPVGLQKKGDAYAVSPSITSPFGSLTPAGTPVDRSLSFRSNASSSASTTYSVKNTFVHVDDGSDSESLDKVKRSASEPNLFKSQPCTTRQRAESEGSTQSIGSEPLVSIGSAAHATGTCRPCAWFWKAHGCVNGSQCRHCHLCSQNEIKRRRYKKLADKKIQKLSEVSQDANVSQHLASSSVGQAL